MDNAYTNGQAGLREKITFRIRHAEKETQQLHQLRELDHLLQKHSDVARILELLDLIKVL